MSAHFDQITALESVQGCIVRMPNAFKPHERHVYPLVKPITVRQWLDLNGIADFDVPTLCLVNGEPVLRAAWSARMIDQGEVCLFLALPQGGGGGGGGGKNPLATVLMVAVMVAAAWAAPAILAANAGLAASLGNMGLAMGLSASGAMTFATAIVGGALVLGGTALISALLPAPSAAPAQSWNGPASTPAPSPTYSLQAQGNQARLGQPIAVHYGRHINFSDLAAEPYQEYQGNEQYLYQLHVIGQGEYDVEQVRIEDTPIENFEEVQTNIVAPGGAFTLVNPNVVTSPEVAGQLLLGTNQLDPGDDGWIGPFVANAALTETIQLGIDIVFARGLYFANSSGGLDSRTITWQVDVREIDEDGEPIGGGAWTTLASESHTAATNTAIRLTFTYPVAPGRYEVRLKRTNEFDAANESRVGHEIRWGQLRAYLEGDVAFGDVTCLELKMRATDNLTQRSSRMINVIATRKLPVWDSGTKVWSAPTATRSLVWALADVLRATYGAELVDSHLPLDEYVALDGVLGPRGNYFDGIFDTQTTVWDAVTRIARCGRAVPIQQGGQVRVIRDAPQSVPVAMFNGRNILRGSFKLRYVMPTDDTAEAAIVEYFDKKTWKPDEVVGLVVDAEYTAWLAANSLADSQAARFAYIDDGHKAARVKLFGITETERAIEEADYIAADNRYRRIFPEFRTSREGMIPSYGDLIAVVHPLPRWGQGGELTDWSADDIHLGAPYENAVLTLSEPVTWTEAATHFISLRRPDGSMTDPLECMHGTTASNVALVDPLPITPYVGASQQRTYYAFGPGETWAKLCRLNAMRPRDGGRSIEIACVVENDFVHVN